MRTVVAFLIAPLTPGMLWALYGGPLIFLFAVPVGYMGALFALPLYLLVRRFWRVSLLSSIAGGLIAGALAGIAFTVWNGPFELSAWYAGGVILFALFGIVAGATFYLIIRLPPHSSALPGKS